MQLIETQIKPGAFQYHVSQDPSVQDDIEIRVHKKADLSDEGVMVHSKKANGGMPTDDEDAFK